MSEQYATIISDPHGCYQSFRALLEQLPAENNRLIIVGDILDRGPDSYNIFQYVREHQVEMILGNHEYMFLNRNNGMQAMQLWMMNGGNETIASVEQAGEPDKKLEEMDRYIRQLPLYIHIPRENVDDLLIVHAGINEHVYHIYREDWEHCFSIDPGDQSSCLWTREKLADIDGMMQVVGHTPFPDAPQQKGNNLYIDSGCVYQRPGLGYMTAVQFELKDEQTPVEIYRQSNIDY